MSELVDATMGEVRRISAELRPSILDDLGLAAAIEWQAKEFERRTGIRCRIQVPGEDTDVGKARSTTLFRIFQEIMTNIARHAGASQVELKLARTARYARLEVHDNGRGITRKEMRDPGALGLLSMRERAMAWGGEVRISGTRGKGTSFRVRIPLESPPRKPKVEPPSPIDGSRRRKERPR
jgi:signal transduction histidine kinase